MASQREPWLKGCKAAVRDQHGNIWCSYYEDSIGACAPEFCPLIKQGDPRVLKALLEVCLEGLLRAIPTLEGRES